MITPQAHIHMVDSGTTEYIFFNTYRKLKQELKQMFKDYGVNEIFVLRSRRGEWGEWYEYWKLNHKGIPYIVKKGWS